MNEFANPAQRLSRLIEQVAPQHEGLTIAAVWAEAFGLDPQNIEADPHDVLAKLMLLRKEIDLAEKLMSETTFSKALYEPYFRRVRSSVSVANISAAWGNYKTNLQADTRLALKYCAEILPTEPEISMEELQSVLDSVHRLREEVDQSELAQAVREFLLSQLAIIEKAIHDYPIRGGVAIKKAFKDGFTDCVAHADNVSAEGSEAEISKIGEIWSAFKSAGKGIVETDRITSSLVGLAEKGQNLLGFFN